MTVVIAREELLRESPKHLPTMFRYDTHAENNSLYNTPSSFSVYMVNEVLKWIEEQGGLQGIEQKMSKKPASSIKRSTQAAGFTGAVWSKAAVRR